VSDELDEIWMLYADDGGQSLDAVEDALRALREDRQNHEAIAALFRAMHTFKGNSRILGLGMIEVCAHLAEDLIGLVRDDGAEVDGELLDLLLQAADTLRSMMEATIMTRHDADEAACAEILLRMKEKFNRLKADGLPAEPFVVEATSDCVDINSRQRQGFESGVIFEPSETKLANDPLYLEIFLDLARDAIATLQQTPETRSDTREASGETLQATVSQLHDAATRIGIEEWAELTQAILDAQTDTARLEALIEQLAALHETHRAILSGDRTNLADPRENHDSHFLLQISSCLEGLTLFARELPSNEEAARQGIYRFAMPIHENAARLGYLTLADTVARLPEAASNFEEFEHLMFALYEDLALIEETETSGSTSHIPQNSLTTPLGTWCVDRTPEVLKTLKIALLPLTVENIDWPRIVELLQRVYRACRIRRHETAAHVAIALVDLVARVSGGEMTPDPPLLRVLASFVDAATHLFASDECNHIYNTDAMTTLLRDANEVTAALSGASSTVWIEEKLGLPQSFRGALSPESAAGAVKALKAGSRFYIIRADIERHPEVGGRFIEWAMSVGGIIGSVTVFDHDSTLFDFLIASSQRAQAIIDGLATLDPKGAVLGLKMMLGEPLIDEEPVAPRSDEAVYSQFEQLHDTAATSMKMLESIGEIVTSHTTMRQILVEIGETNIAGIIDSTLRCSNGDRVIARESLQRHVLEWQENIERLVQLESHISNRLDQLQEEAVSARGRPAVGLISSLVRHGEEFAEHLSRDVHFSVSGERETIDIDLLDQLSEPLRSLIRFTVKESIESPEKRVEKGKCVSGDVHISLSRYEDRVVATIEDDGAGVDALSTGDMLRHFSQLGATQSEKLPQGCISAALEPAHNTDLFDFSPIFRKLYLAGGEVAMTKSSMGGIRFDVTLPLSMAVLDGMVVRVGAIMYVVPIQAIQRIVHSSDANLIHLSAANGNAMLRLGCDDVIPVRFLSGARDEIFSADARRRLSPPQNDNEETDDARHLFVVAGKSNQRVALSIDELIGQQLVLIRPMKGYLSSIRDVMGCALLGNGGVGMVLDPARLSIYTL